MKKTERFTHTVTIILLLLAQTYTSHPYIIHKSHTHNMYVCVCLSCMWSMPSSSLRVKKTCVSDLYTLFLNFQMGLIHTENLAVGLKSQNMFASISTREQTDQA